MFRETKDGGGLYELRCGKVILVVGPCEDVDQANGATALAQQPVVARENAQSSGSRRFRNSPPHRPTVSPLLTPVASRNVLLLQSLPDSIPYRQAKVRRRKDDTRVGTAARGIVERLSRLP